MHLQLNKEMLGAIGVETLKEFGYTEDQWRWKHGFDVSLPNLTKAQVIKLRGILEKKLSVRGVNNRISDIDVWLKVLENPGKSVRCRKIKDFASMCKQYLKTAPNQWLYEKRDSVPGVEVWQPYYVNSITYHPPEKMRGYTVPAHVVIHLYNEELGEVKSYQETFWREDCEDLTVPMALAEKGYVVQDQAKLDTYLENTRRYKAIYDKIGLQFKVWGTGDTGVDSADSDSSGWWRRESGRIRLDRDGEPARVVVDVLNESGKEKSGRDNRPSGDFWREEACDLEGSEGDNDETIEPGDEDDDQTSTKYEPQVPLMPSLVVFDLKRQKRMKVYVDQMVQYEYQRHLGDKLILPEDVRGLVNMLVQHRGGFKDIVGGKGSGAIVLCCGAPGTGKTLTSEVYSEAMERPLYSVQCSQLGTDPDELEKELLKVFVRAVRWNAILLLDEADVYVARRGSDLQQNAIVGVFLRVLEYFSGVLFLTTNRADLVDDAIASRCLARLVYKVPTPENQAKIWRTLSDTAEIPLSDKEIEQIVADNPKASGRDVKNLLKLAWMVSQARGLDYVNAKMVRYVRQFKPTEDVQD